MDRKKIAEFVKAQLQNEMTGHDYWHGQRVAKLAQKLFLQDIESYTQEQLDIIYTAGFIHDTIDDKVTDEPDKVLTQIKQLLSSEFDTDAINNILFTIQNMSFSKNIEEHHQLSIEGQYVQDADRIESLGAMGIARAFVYSGHHDDRIYDPNVPVVELKNKVQYRNHQETTINHFYEKLFKLEDLMNTPSAKKLAHERTRYMKDFVTEFMKEWNVSD